MAAVQSHFEHDGISCQSGAPQHRGCFMLENSRSRHMCVVSVAVAEDVGRLKRLMRRRVPHLRRTRNSSVNSIAAGADWLAAIVRISVRNLGILSEDEVDALAQVVIDACDGQTAGGP